MTFQAMTISVNQSAAETFSLRAVVTRGDFVREHNGVSLRWRTEE